MAVVFFFWARSSGGERYLDTVEVDGSRPSAPTIPFKGIEQPSAVDAFSFSGMRRDESVAV